jgi:hypothetical protein
VTSAQIRTWCWNLAYFHLKVPSLLSHGSKHSTKQSGSAQPQEMHIEYVVSVWQVSAAAREAVLCARWVLCLFVLFLVR